MLSVIKKQFIIVIAIISVHSNAFAQELVFTPRIEAGTWMFNSQLSGDMYEENKQRTWFDINEIMAVLQLGASLQWREFYVDAYVQQSTSGSDVPNNETLLEDGVDSYANQEADIERSEYSLLVGYQFPSQVSLFIGYRFQETDINETLPQNYELIPEARSPDTWDINIESNGPFLGLKYIMPIDANNSLSLSTSLGFFEQTYQNAYTQVIGTGEFSQFKMLFDFETDVIDLGLGAVYTHKLTNELEVNVQGQLNYYSFDERLADKRDTPDLAENFDVSADELNFQIRLGLQYRF